MVRVPSPVVMTNSSDGLHPIGSPDGAAPDGSLSMLGSDDGLSGDAPDHTSGTLAASGRANAEQSPDTGVSEPTRLDTEAASTGGSDDSYEPLESLGVKDVRRFCSTSGRRVDVICSCSNNPIESLSRFWTSLVVNFLRPDGCVNGFPRSTLGGHGELKSDLTDCDRLAVGKYEERGFVLTAQQVRNDGDLWEDTFLGRREVLVWPFRSQVSKTWPVLPIGRSDQGWFVCPYWPPSDGEHLGSYDIHSLIKL